MRGSSCSIFLYCQTRLMSKTKKRCPPCRGNVVGNRIYEVCRYIHGIIFRGSCFSCVTHCQSTHCLSPYQSIQSRRHWSSGGSSYDVVLSWRVFDRKAQSGLVVHDVRYLEDEHEIQGSYREKGGHENKESRLTQGGKNNESPKQRGCPMMIL